MSYSTVACCFRTGVIHDCPTLSTSPLLCVVYAIQKVHFDITLISLGRQNERYYEAAVYFYIYTQSSR